MAQRLDLSNLKTRTATPNDYNFVLDTMRAYTAQSFPGTREAFPYHEWLRSPEIVTEVAYCDPYPDHLVACKVSTTDGGVVWVYTRSLFRRNGVAQRLLKGVSARYSKPRPIYEKLFSSIPMKLFTKWRIT